MKDKDITEYLQSMEVMYKASAPNLDEQDVEAVWYNRLYKYRLTKWQQELQDLCVQSRMDLTTLAKLTTGNDNPWFYNKLPKRKDTYVRIGIALNQPRSIIDRWIVKNSKSPRLYAKDPLDAIAIKYIEENLKNHNLNALTSYISAVDAYNKLDKEKSSSERKSHSPAQVETTKVELELGKVNSNPAETAEYVLANACFANTNKRAHVYLKEQAMRLIESYNKIKAPNENSWTMKTLYKLRILSTTEYNYLTSTPEKRQPIRHKKSYIEFALRLGMDLSQINKLLELAGFDRLNINDERYGLAEFKLPHLLNLWDELNQDAVKWRQKYVYNENISISKKDERQGLFLLIGLREDDNNDDYLGSIDCRGLRYDINKLYYKGCHRKDFPF